MGSDGKSEPPTTGWTGPVPSSKGGTDEPQYILKPPYMWYSDEFKVKYTASCWCEKIHFEFADDPVDAKHCHCTQCQRLHGAPFQWAALMHKSTVRLSKDSDPTYLSFFSTQRREGIHDVPVKVSCRACGSRILDEGRNMVMAYPSCFNFKNGEVPPAFAPTAHIFYSESLIEIDDGVPKWSGHKDTSERLDHCTGAHGKIGHGKSGRKQRGEHKGEDEQDEQTTDRKNRHSPEEDGPAKRTRSENL